jgi:hypothetical protein
MHGSIVPYIKYTFLLLERVKKLKHFNIVEKGYDTPNTILYKYIQNKMYIKKNKSL